MKTKFTIAILVAIAGLVLAARSILRTVPSKPVSNTSSQMPLKESPAEIGSQFRDYDDPESVRLVVRKSVEQAITNSNIPQIILDKDPEDLKQIVVERFQLLLTTDFERDIEALVKRGATYDIASGDPEGQERLIRWMSLYNDSKLSFEDLSIRVVCRNGVWIDQAEMMGGYNRSMTEIRGSLAPPVPEKPSETASDVIEVRVPMLVDSPEVGEHEVIMAYMLIWDSASVSWLPFRSIVYHPHNQVSYSAPFL